MPHFGDSEEKGQKGRGQEGFRDSDDDDDDDDVTAPPKSSRGRDGKLQYMQQSIFSIIAAAGTRSDFHARFDESSDSDGEAEKVVEQGSTREAGYRSHDRGTDGDNATSPENRRGEVAPRHQTPLDRKSSEHRRKPSENRLPRSLPKLQLRHGKGKDLVVTSDPISREGSPSASSTSLTGSMTPPAAPVLSRMIEAQTRFDPAASHTESKCLVEQEDSNQTHTQPTPTNLLSTRLMEIFGFEKPEKVIGEYPCWLLQSVLLQGYMYVTEGHICFYAYLSQRSNTAVKSGFLAKRGRKNPQYHRYWFSLKGDVLSYYADPPNLYFPSGQIDLRYGISASLIDQKDKEKDMKDFTVTTNQRTYLFRADSATSAKEWVKALQKVIFRSLNEGDSVKISFPVENVIDIEESPMIDFAETFKIRVVDSGETYAIDEVCS
jgi:sterol 3beta-glucosyltransferase